MRESVRDNFTRFSSPLEGVVPWMYLDILGKVTTAIGVLIDAPGEAKALPWVLKSNPALPASDHEVGLEWNLVKGSPHLASAGHRAAEHMTRLRLLPNGIEAAVQAKLDAFDAALVKRFPDFEEWPADAQLATLSMAWACGPWFRFGTLETALLAQDWLAAKASCHINETGNPGVVPRNVLNKQLYENAFWTAEHQADPETLIWSADVSP